MKVIDDTKLISEYLAEKCKLIRCGSYCGSMDWCRFMSVVDGVVTTKYKTLFLRRERTFMKDNVIANFEIWKEHTIAIPKDAWNKVFTLVNPVIKKFERETGQSIIIKKVDSPTQWD